MSLCGNTSSVIRMKTKMDTMMNGISTVVSARIRIMFWLKVIAHFQMANGCDITNHKDGSKPGVHLTFERITKVFWRKLNLLIFGNCNSFS